MCIYRTLIGVGDVGSGRARAPLKFEKKIFLGQLLCKIWAFFGQKSYKFGYFDNFLGKNHVKFRHFADF